MQHNRSRVHYEMINIIDKYDTAMQKVFAFNQATGEQILLGKININNATCAEQDAIRKAFDKLQDKYQAKTVAISEYLAIVPRVNLAKLNADLSALLACKVNLEFVILKTKTNAKIFLHDTTNDLVKEHALFSKLYKSAYLQSMSGWNGINQDTGFLKITIEIAFYYTAHTGGQNGIDVCEIVLEEDGSYAFNFVSDIKYY